MTASQALAHLRPRTPGGDLEADDLAAGLRPSGRWRVFSWGAPGGGLLEQLRSKGYVLTSVQHDGSAGDPVVVLSPHAQAPGPDSVWIDLQTVRQQRRSRRVKWSDIVLKRGVLDDEVETLHLRSGAGAQARRWRMFAIVDRTHTGGATSGLTAEPMLMLLPAVQGLRLAAARLR